MKIEFLDTDFFTRQLIKKVFKRCLRELNQPTNMEVCFSCVDNETIKQLNNQYRNVDKATDVLSFPMLDIVAGEKLSDSRFLADVDPQNNNVAIGDIYVCLQVAAMQAMEYNHSVKREVAFLALHGLLHLLGYDHITDEQALQMTKVSEQILQALKITRDV